MKKASPAYEELIRAILALKNRNEARRFLRDLLTENELVEFANRWKAAQMLNADVPYPRIEQETGLSTTTIARVSKWLRHGMGGYKLILQRLHAHPPHPSVGSRLR